MKTLSRNVKTALVVIIILVLFLSFLNSKRLHITEVHRGLSHELDDGWHLEIGDLNVDDASLSKTEFPPMNRGDAVVVSQVLPATADGKSIPNPEMVLFSDHSSVEVYIDGGLVYEYGLQRTIDNKFVGYGYHYVRLPYDYPGKEIVIRMIAAENAGTRTVRAPIIYDSTDRLRDYANEHKHMLFLNVFLAILGLCLAIFGLFLWARQNASLRLVAIGGYSFFLSMWSLCNYHLMDIFSNDFLMKNYMEYFSLYFTLLFFLAYFWSDLKDRDTLTIRVVYKSLIVAQVLFIVVVAITHSMDLLHISAATWGQVALICVYAVGILAICIYDIFTKSFTSTPLLVGIVSIVAFTLLDLVNYVIMKFSPETNDSHFISVTCLGGAVFVLCLVWDLYIKNERNREEMFKTETYQKLAYTDFLTGIGNRRKFEETLFEHEKTGEDFVLFAIDVNGLKHVNDTYGHEQGDLLINLMAECLKKAFGDKGTYARVGGDEFAIFSSAIRTGEEDGYLDSFRKEIDKKNLTLDTWKMSAACGYCRKSEYPDMTGKDIYKIADSRMYIKKAQMKKEMEKRL